MNAFSPIRIKLNSSPRLLFLYLFSYAFGSIGLFQLNIGTEAIWLAWIVYSLLLGLLLWRDIFIPAPERIETLYWDVEHRRLSVKTAEGDWVEVEHLHQSCSLPGVVQILSIQRSDRYAPTRLVITPDRLSNDDRRRLHVAITWAAPLEPHPAKDSSTV